MVAAHLTGPRPASLATGLTCKYDAWNRLVEVTDGETVVATHEYDGLNRRTIESPTPGSTYYMHKFYNSSWQIVESRDDLADADPENVEPCVQYVWSPRYIDAAVLRDENTDEDGLCDDERLYYLCDANFNVTTLTTRPAMRWSRPLSLNCVNYTNNEYADAMARFGFK